MLKGTKKEKYVNFIFTIRLNILNILQNTNNILLKVIIANFIKNFTESDVSIYLEVFLLIKIPIVQTRRKNCDEQTFSRRKRIFTIRLYKRP